MTHVLEYYEASQLPIVVIDNFYNDQEYRKIWKELNFLLSDKNRLHDPAQTGSAYDVDERGNYIYKKQNKAVFLDELYNDRTMSFILNANRKVFQSDIQKTLRECHKIFEYLALTNMDNTLISYYENSDFYDYHFDTSVFTFITWFYQKPKAFTGGELSIEGENRIDCLDNRLVIFPSILHHKVEQISLSEQTDFDIPGRITMSQFTGLTLQ